MKLLLVEDDPLNVEFFVDVLERDGHTVTVERDGIAGRDRALGDVYDLVILDVQLPGMSGDQICRQIRDAGIRHPVIALSASALPGQIEVGIDAGFDAYLTKPISPGELRAAVREWGAEGRKHLSHTP